MLESMVACGTEELRQKHRVEFESIDLRGVFKRARVTDQTYIDCLFLEKLITAPQYSAAEEYMYLMLKSGAFLRSPGWEDGPRSTGRDKGKAMSSRIMAISGARDRLRREAGPDATLAVDLAVASDAPVSVALLRQGLDVLSMYFGTTGVKDPRKI